MRYGVEVEFMGSRTEAMAAIRRAGIPIVEAAYSGGRYDVWQMKTDSSVPGGGELVSRILDYSSEADREELVKAISTLRASGGRTDERAGVHVTLDVSGLGPETLASVFRNLIKFEDVLYRIGTSGWRTLRPRAGTYCAPLCDGAKRKLPKAKTFEGLKRAFNSPGSNGRGSMVNITKLDRGRLEFRLFNSTVNPERVLAYVALCIGLVEDAKTGKKRSTTKAFALGQMKSLPTDQQWKQYVALYNVLRYSAKIPLADVRLITRCWHDSAPQDRPERRYF